MSNIKSALGVFALGLMLGGCSTTSLRSTPESMIMDRAAERWGHILDGRIDKAYEYLTPGVREVTTLDGYRGRIAGSQVKWTAATPERVECESEDKCIAFVKIDFELLAPVRGVGQVKSQQVARETWLRSEGKWYFMPRRPAR